MMRRDDSGGRDGVLRDLVRLLHGELSAADERRVTARLREEADLRARFEALRRLWQMSGGALLHRRVPEEAEPDLWPRVRRRMHAERAMPLRWRAAPLWVRTAAVAALLAGLGIGTLAGSRPTEAGVTVEMEVLTSTTAESYWRSLAAPTGADLPEEGR